MRRLEERAAHLRARAGRDGKVRGARVDGRAQVVARDEGALSPLAHQQRVALAVHVRGRVGPAPVAGGTDPPGVALANIVARA